MERRPGMDTPRAAPALPAPVSAALALGLAFVLAAGDAAAQNLCAGDVVTGRTTIAVCDRAAGETRDIHINLRNPAISLTGFNESPVTADTYGVGSVTIEVTGGSLSSSGNWAKGIRSWLNGGSGDVAVTVKDVDITTANDNGNAVYVRRQAGTGNIRIDVSGGVLTTTGGGVSQGITGWLQVAGDIDIDTKDVVMRTEGANSLGIFGYQQGPTGDVDVAVQGGSIETNGFLAHGVYSGKIGGTGNADLSVSGASVTTRGRFTRAVNGVSSGEGGVTVDVSGEAVIVAEGEGSVGVYLLHAGNGSVDATIGSATRIAAPFANGVHGRLMPSANAAGRVVIDARSRIEARDTGILAWAEPRSGSTFGGGGSPDGSGRTAPMIHVVSSGDVTVGEGVMDAWIRAAVAGDDGTLSAGEQAVLDAIAGGGSDALDTALAALPAGYTGAWKTRMRAFRAARGAKRTDRHGSQGNAPGANARLAEEAAVEILDIPRAGIRAMALSHVEIADYIRGGGPDGTLPAAERTVLEAVLTGGDLETALGALSADYTNTWKDGVRLRAQGYSSGDIQVDVTGGTIASEGDGVHARYALTHDRNGAITVTVAEGARVTGGRNGIFVGGAGLAAGSRAQTVRVDGVVMGGTGAGVHMAGGGLLVIGRNARIGASSGLAVLADGGAVRVVGRNGVRSVLTALADGDGDGELVVVIVDPDEFGEGAPRILGRIEEVGGTPRVLLQRSGSSESVELRAGGAPVGSGPWDVSVVRDGSGLRVVRELGPRVRLYEALPSVLLGMNGLPRFRERMAAPRTERGGWARVEASRGEWKADSSTTGVEYNHRRSDLRAGLDVPAGENGLFGMSVHHRLGSADVARGGGIKLSGSGAGVSGTWFGFGAYVDVQAETTWYEADVRSTAPGTMKKDVSGRGHALGVEVGRRMAVPELGEGVVLTPRAGLVHSRASVGEFTDAVGARVLVDRARSLKGRLGVVVEADGSPNRLSGSLDVEHELSGDMKVRMTGMDLAPEAEATWVRLGLNGSHAWDGGRYMLRGGVSYATSGESYEVGGGISLEVRF